MRPALLSIFILAAANVCWADEAPKASGVLDGKKVKFPKESIAEGVNAAIGLLESCHDESLYNADELKKAHDGDHIRLVLAKPVVATVMEKRVDVSELVFRLPMNTGVFWVRAGDRWRRYSKYEFEKEAPFTTWLREARTAD
jgi:hypothetical protein